MLKRLITCLLLCGHISLLAQELNYNHCTANDGLAQMQIEDLLLDSHGALWIAIRGTVSRYNGCTIDSFEVIDVNSGFCYEIIEDSNGQWIDNALRNGVFKISEDENILSTEFESIGLNASNNLAYSYFLEGYNEEWSTFSKYNNCSYNNLDSGNYIFKVKNNQSDEATQQGITIDIPLYTASYLGGISGIAGIVSIGFLLLTILLGKNYRLAKKNNQLLKLQKQQLLNEKKLVYQKSELEGINIKLKQDFIAIQHKLENGHNKIEIKANGMINLIPSKNLMYIHAEENGCRYFLKDATSFWNDERLRTWEENLDPSRFVRIHRSTLVQKEYILKISYDLINLIDGTKLKIGRKYKDNL